MGKEVYIVAGLQFGDEGKGSIVDFLVRTTGAKLVVRYNGGPQAAHNVVTPEGHHHTFAQFGSGSFIPKVDTYLSRYMLIDPLAFFIEHNVFIDKVRHRPKVYVEESCPIITPYHVLLNRMREEHRGKNRHGSCGMGIGELNYAETR